MEWIFGRKRASPERSLSHLYPFSLPESFAQQVLDLEGELDIQCSIPTIRRLMQLYSNAIQYYESIKDQKYLHYQDRLQHLLSRKDVLYALQEPQKQPSPSKTDIIDIKKQQVSKRQRLLSYKVHIEHNSELFAQKSAKETLESYNNESASQLKKLKQNLDNQQNSLSVRLEQRKARTRENSLSPNKNVRRISIQNVKEEDISGGSPSDTPMQRFEAKMEEILEKYLIRKNKAKKNIEKKYQLEIEEMSEMGGFSLFEGIVEVMKKKMEIEIEEVNQKLDQEKKKEIMKMRQGSSF